jgi:hypothetical protein
VVVHHPPIFPTWAVWGTHARRDPARRRRPPDVPVRRRGREPPLLDGAELAAAIAAHPDDIETALAAYERALFPRSEAVAAESASNLVICFRPDAPHGLLDLMAQYRGEVD